MSNHKYSKGIDGFWEKYRALLSSKEYAAFEKYQQQSLRKTIRINTLLEFSSDKGGGGGLNFIDKNYPKWQLTPHIFADHVYAIDRDDTSQPLGCSIAHQTGIFYIQEASSALPPRILDPSPDDIVLDLCSAPGSKTTQLSSMMAGEGLIVANELSASRSKALVTNITKCGVLNSIVTNFDGVKLCELLPATFDKILVDAPCSGEGTYRKDRKALEYWTQEKSEQLAKIQKQLLLAAWKALKVGGEIVYATCTLAPEENEIVVAWLQQKIGNGLEIIDISVELPKATSGLEQYQHHTFLDHQKMIRLWPHDFDNEGFFVVKIKKTQLYLSESSTKHKPLKHPPSFVKPQLARQINTYLEQQFGWQLPTTHILVKRAEQIWALPQAAQKIITKIKVDRLGIPLGRWDERKNVVHLSFEAAKAFGSAFTKNIVEVDYHTACTYYTGIDIECKEVTSGQVIMMLEKIPLGTAKVVNGKLKNQLPRHLVERRIY